MSDPKALASPNRPTMYFIGVSTGGSAIHKIFPKWMDFLGLEQATLIGVDIPLLAEPERYRQVVEHIKQEPLAHGALVTSHKVDLYQSCRDLIDESDHYARHLGEASCLTASDRILKAAAIDPITTLRTLQEHRPVPFPENAEALSIGAGGAGLALAAGALLELPTQSQPAAVHLIDREADRLEEVKKSLTGLGCDPDQLRLHQTHGSSENDQIVQMLPKNSLIVNATGMGKDTPGSPVTNRVTYPENTFVWELNYRGPRPFLYHAMQQADQRGLQVEDGWRLFVINWAIIISRVFDRPLQTGELADLAALAEPFRPARK